MEAEFFILHRNDIEFSIKITPDKELKGKGKKILQNSLIGSLSSANYNLYPPYLFPSNHPTILLI